MDEIAANDALRTSLKGGVIELSPSVRELPEWFRGRALIRLALHHEHINEDHSEGAFTFGGFCFYWMIAVRSGKRILTLSLARDGLYATL
jgi:hypothetical protein